MALTDKLTAIGDAIRSKTGGSELLTLDEMPQEIQGIQTGGGGGADTGLADSIVDGTITSYSSDIQTLRASAFAYCAKLTSVSLPNVTSIPGDAFSYCTKLASCDFPKVKTIAGSYTFTSCLSLEKIIFPSLTDISDMGIWTGCKSTLALILPNSTVATCGYVGASWNSTPFNKGQGYIYVPKALIEQYKVATNWVTFASKFRAIEDYPDICGEVA